MEEPHVEIIMTEEDADFRKGLAGRQSASRISALNKEFSAFKVAEDETNASHEYLVMDNLLILCKKDG